MDKLRGIDKTLQRQAPYGVDARERLIKPMATAARANSQVHLLLLTRIHDEVVRWTKRCLLYTSDAADDMPYV